MQWLRMTSWKRFWNQEERKELVSLLAEVLQKVPELVVHERMSQCKKGKGTEENNKVNVLSTEEIKNKSSEDSENDTAEMIEWRSMSQEEMDVCWKRLAEKMEEEVLDKYNEFRTAKEVLTEAEALCWNGACTKKQNTNVGRRLLGENLRLVQRIQLAASANHV